MPVQYELDIQNHMVRTTLSGLITHREVADHSARLHCDPDFDPGFCELVAFQGNADIQLGLPELQDLLRLDPFSSTSRRAFVIGSRTEVLGFLRAYQNLRGDSPYVRVFQTADEAILWLSARARRAG